MTETASTWMQRSRWAVVVGAIGLFLVLVGLFHVPGQGFSALLVLGDHEPWENLPELRDQDLFIQRYSPGYDAEHYVQLAMRPQVTDPALRVAVDNLPYRARRILLSWSAWIFGGGDPERIVNVYALQGVVAWLVLAGLLLRWLPPTNWGNVGRWSAVMFTFGLCTSVRTAVVDGPAVVMIAGAVALIETGRRWLGAVILGLAGLVRETAVLAAVALLPHDGQRRSWLVAAAQGLLVVAPLGAWVLYLTATLGTGEDVGTRNFSLPFGGYLWAWREAWRQLQLDLPWVGRSASLLVLIALTVQALFFALRPRWSNVWWRIGITYGALMAFLGWMVWEGQPGAAARVLLPMTLAFNLLVPRGRWWTAVLMAGNLAVIPSVLTLPNTIRDIHRIEGPRQWVQEAPERWRVWYDQFWYSTEASRFGGTRWRWASRSAGVVVYNPHDLPVRANVRFALASTEEREVTFSANGVVQWRGPVDRLVREGRADSLVLPPGYSRWVFATEGSAEPVTPTDLRPLAFNLRDFRIEVLGSVE